MKRRLIARVRGYFWVFLGSLWLISVLDFVDHVTRTNTSDFRDAWLAWLGFTLGSIGCITLLLLAGHLIGARRGLWRLLIDLAVCMASLPVHVCLTGPIMDRVFWDGGLIFDGFNPALLVPIAALYLVVRGVFQIGVVAWSRVRRGDQVLNV